MKVAVATYCDHLKKSEGDIEKYHKSIAAWGNKEDRKGARLNMTKFSADVENDADLHDQKWMNLNDEQEAFEEIGGQDGGLDGPAREMAKASFKAADDEYERSSRLMEEHINSYRRLKGKVLITDHRSGGPYALLLLLRCCMISWRMWCTARWKCTSPPCRGSPSSPSEWWQSRGRRSTCWIRSNRPRRRKRRPPGRFRRERSKFMSMEAPPHPPSHPCLSP